MKNSAPDALLSQRSVAPSSSPPDPNSRGLAPAVAPTARRSPTKKSNASDALDTDAENPKAGDKSKKRVRLKPETREQLLERLRNPPLSLHETSILLRVSRATVRRYADAGRLPCLRTPGGQRRFSLRDIEAFYRQLRANAERKR